MREVESDPTFVRMPDSHAPAAAAVTIKLVYLARLRDAFGKSAESLELPAAPTVADVFAVLRARGDPWARELAALGGIPNTSALASQNLNRNVVCTRRIGFASVGKPNCGLPTIVFNAL